MASCAYVKKPQGLFKFLVFIFMTATLPIVFAEDFHSLLFGSNTDKLYVVYIFVGATWIYVTVVVMMYSLDEREPEYSFPECVMDILGFIFCVVVAALSIDMHFRVSQGTRDAYIGTKYIIMFGFLVMFPVLSAILLIVDLVFQCKNRGGDIQN